MLAHNQELHAYEREGDLSSSELTPAPVVLGAPKAKQVRRLIACKLCHSLKVKCAPLDERNPAGPCVRCVNLKRHCEIDLNQTRKRRKKLEMSEHRQEEVISQLRAQVRELQLQLAAGGREADGGEGSGASGSLVLAAGPRVNAAGAAPLAESGVIGTSLTENGASAAAGIGGAPGAPRPPPGPFRMLYPNDSPVSDANSPLYVSKYDLEREILLLCKLSTTLTELTDYLKSTADRRTTLLHTDAVTDVVSSGVVSLEEARQRLELYRLRIYVAHPLVEVPESDTVEVLQKTQPYLLNAIMSVTNAVYTGPVSADHALTIDNEAVRLVTIEILVAGTKNVELIKAILLLCLWYNTPELFRHRRYHILNLILVTLLHDLGIVARPTYLYRKNAVEADATGEEPLMEYVRLVVILYFTTVNICLILRRAIYVKWTPFVERCCHRLEVLGEPSLEHLALFLRLNHQLERIHHVVHLPDSDLTHALRYVVQELQKNLTMIRIRIPKDNHACAAYYYSVEAYLHEPVLNDMFLRQDPDADDTDLVSLLVDDGPGVHLNEHTLRSISSCTALCLRALDEFNELSAEGIATLPLLHLLRIIYTAGMLLRLRYLILSLPLCIEKSLVPKHAIVAIQRLNRLIDLASSTHTVNYFLKKLRLVLQLFIQTYLTQVQELLSANGETPENFAPRFGRREQSELQRLLDLYRRLHYTGLITTDLGNQFGNLPVPLSLMPYTSSVCRDTSRLWPERGSPSRRLMDKPTPPQPPLVHPGAPAAVPPPPTGTAPVPPIAPPQSASALTGPAPPGPIFPQQGAFPGSTHPALGMSPPSLRYNQTVKPDPAGPPLQNASYQQHQESPPLVLFPPVYANGAVPGYSDVQRPDLFTRNLADADLLELLYLALNDEFWLNLLSTEQDKINFSNVNRTIPEEVFFMN